MSGEIIPKSLGINFKPPNLILLYEIKTSGKTRKRSMPVRDLTKNCDCYLLAEKVKKRHEKYLNSIAAVRIEKMLRILQLTMFGESLKDALNTVQYEFMINFEEDMNRLSDKDLRRRKELMDINFQKNQVKVGDPGFVYDKQVDFSQMEKVESGWDNEDGDEEDFWN